MTAWSSHIVPAPAARPVTANADGDAPPRIALGVNTVHRYTEPSLSLPVIAITAHVPMPSPEHPGHIADTNAKPYQQPLPDRFVLGDAGRTRAFVFVDKRPGSPLSAALDRLVAQIPTRGGQPHPDDVLGFLRTQTNRWLRWTAGSSFNDGRAEFAWDKAIRVSDRVLAAFSQASAQQVCDAPLATGDDFPCVPMERYLEIGEGYCIHKALLAALLLDRLRIPFRLVNGAVRQGPGRSVGHTWIELADGRILDPAWGSLAAKGASLAGHPEMFAFGSGYRFANDRYPYLVLS